MRARKIEDHRASTKTLTNKLFGANYSDYVCVISARNPPHNPIEELFVWCQTRANAVYGIFLRWNLLYGCTQIFVWFDDCYFWVLLVVMWSCNLHRFYNGIEIICIPVWRTLFMAIDSNDLCLCMAIFVCAFLWGWCQLLWDYRIGWCVQLRFYGFWERSVNYREYLKGTDTFRSIYCISSKRKMTTNKIRRNILLPWNYKNVMNHVGLNDTSIQYDSHHKTLAFLQQCLSNGFRRNPVYFCDNMKNILQKTTT